MHSVTSNAVAELSSEIDTSNWNKTNDLIDASVTCFRIAYNIAIVEIFCGKRGTGTIICEGNINTNGKVKRNIFGSAALGYSVAAAGGWNIIPKWCQVNVSNGVINPLFVWDTDTGDGNGKVTMLVELND